MPAPDVRAHRLRYEVMDWCNAVQYPGRPYMDAHRHSIQWRPEVWDT